MVFSSAIFLFAFLPLVLAGYYLTLALRTLRGAGRRVQPSFAVPNAFLLFVSVVFYFWGEQWLFGVMLLSTVLDYAAGLGMGAARTRPMRRLLLAVSVAGNLSLLAFFKYFGFGLENFNALVTAAGLESWRLEPLFRITLPLGISFYTFQTMSYTIDVYRGEVRPVRNFVDFAAFVTLFPQLVAGPIVRYRDVADQLGARAHSFERFAAGCVRFITGLGKKMLIANTVALPADRIFALPPEQLTPALAWLGACCYTIQIYFDFSGYSDMAIGIGHMLGFRFPENFNYPYAARSMQDFWRRWHMTLSTFFRDYVYIPLGGGRGPTWRVYFNLLTVFFLCGLWHGASWTFVVWGLFHGLFLVLERLGGARWLARCPLLLRHGYVLGTVVIGWVLFRSDSFAQALPFLASMAGTIGANAAAGPRLAEVLTQDVGLALAVGAIASAPVVAALRALKDRLAVGRLGAPLGNALWEGLRFAVLGTTVLLSLLAIYSGTYNPFIYFRF